MRNPRTGKPYDNKSKHYIDWTDKALMDEAQGLNWIVNVIETFGTRDVLKLIMATDELSERGYEVNEESSLTFVHAGEN